MLRIPVITMLLLGGWPLNSVLGACPEQPATQVNQQNIVFRFDGSVWVMNADGKNRRQLTNTTNCGFPFWLPGGKQVVFFSTLNAQKQCYVVDGDGTGEMARHVPEVERFAVARKAVEDESLHLGMPDLSPDGKQIVFRNVRQIGENCPGDEHVLDLYLINVDGTNLRQLTNDAAAEYQARWSPDGKNIVFDSVVDDGNWNIYLMNGDGSGRRRLTDDKAHYSRPVWSPDGTRIAFNSNRHNTKGRGGGIYVMDINGSNLHQLTGLPGDNIIGGAHADWYVRPYAFPNWPDYMWPPAHQRDPVSNADHEAEQSLTSKGAYIVRDEQGAVFYVRLRDRNRFGVLTRPFNDSDVANVTRLHWRTTRRDCRPFAGPTLVLGDNPISDEGLALIVRKVAGLRSLSLGSGFHDGSLKHVGLLAHLEMLSLANAQVTDSGLDHLRALVNLKRLDLRGTKISSKAVLSLSNALPNCEIVSP